MAIMHRSMKISYVYLLFKEFVSESSKIKETAEMKTNTREGTVLFFFFYYSLSAWEEVQIASNILPSLFKENSRTI